MFLACVYVLMGYGAAAHVDSGDPHFTAGFRVDRLAHERPGDNFSFWSFMFTLPSKKDLKKELLLSSPGAALPSIKAGS
jgi:hypothetical protein